MKQKFCCVSLYSFSIYIILYFFKFVKQDSFCLVPPRLTTSLPTHMVGQGRFELPNQLRSGFTIQFLLFKSLYIYYILFFDKNQIFSFKSAHIASILIKSDFFQLIDRL
jgi:hypothetical protein